MSFDFSILNSKIDLSEEKNYNLSSIQDYFKNKKNSKH